MVERLCGTTFMRAIAGAMLALMTTIAFAQDAAAPTRPPQLKEGEIKHFERIAEIPEMYLNAIKKVPCQFDESIVRDAPPFMFYFRPNHYFLVVNCRHIVGYSYVFSLDRQADYRPEPLIFPVFAPPTGVGVSRSPGWIEWNAESKTLTATHHTDVCPAEILRYTYRYGGTYEFDNRDGWILTKVELGRKDCGQGGSWSTFWEPPALPQR